MNLRIALSSFVALFFLLSSNAYAQHVYGKPGEQVAVPKDLSHGVPFGYYEYLPEDFDTSPNSKKKYPLVIYYSGVGGLGNGSLKDLAKLMKPVAPPKLLGPEGKDYPAIIISAQHGGWFEEKQSKQLYDYITSHYPVDSNRVYVTGLSAGGAGTWRFARAYPDLVTAIVPIAGAIDYKKAVPYLRSMPIWAFHNVGDGWGGGGVPSIWTLINGDQIANIKDPARNSYPGGWGYNKRAGFDVTLHFMDSTYWDADSTVNAPKQNMALTIYDALGHNGWGKTYRNQAMWDWLLGQTKKKTDQVIVNAGKDAEVILPISELVIQGNASSLSKEPIISYQWKQVKGPSIKLSGLSSPKLTLNNLKAGEYEFQLSAVNAKNVSGSDAVTIVVRAKPKSDAGNDIYLKLPVNHTYLEGVNSSDEDGRIIKYQWKLLSSDEDTATGSTVDSKIFINLTTKAVQAAAPWNNLNGSISKGVKLTDALDSNGNVTSVDVEFLDNWDGAKSGGKVTGNNSGVYPDDVIEGTYWFQNRKPRIKIKGLEPGGRYDFTFFGSRTGKGLDKTTVYKIGTVQASVNAAENTSQTAVLSSVLADANGEVLVEIKRGTSAAYGYLNAIVIHHYAPLTTKSVASSTLSSSSVSSASSTGSLQNILVNFSTPNYHAQAPWNNTNGMIYNGNVLTDLKNDQGVSTGIDITLLDTWNGNKNGGRITGNNSGVYPDKVIESTYWFQNKSPRIEVSGLDFTKNYDFTFFASRTGKGLDKTTVYKIGASKDSLDAAENTSDTAQLVGITPDANGNVVIEVSTGVNAIYGYLNAFVISESSIAPPPPSSITLKDAGKAVATVSGLKEGSYTFELTVTDNSGLKDVDSVSVFVSAPVVPRKGKGEVSEQVASESVSQLIKVYPNPASEILYIDFLQGINDPGNQISLFNNTGKELPVDMRRNGQKIIVDVSNLKKGFYYLKLNKGGSQFDLHKVIIL